MPLRCGGGSHGLAPPSAISARTTRRWMVTAVISARDTAGRRLAVATLRRHRSTAAFAAGVGSIPERMLRTRRDRRYLSESGGRGPSEIAGRAGPTIEQREEPRCATRQQGRPAKPVCSRPASAESWASAAATGGHWQWFELIVDAATHNMFALGCAGVQSSAGSAGERCRGIGAEARVEILAPHPPPVGEGPFDAATEHTADALAVAAGEGGARKHRLARPGTAAEGCPVGCRPAEGQASGAVDQQ